ncbi:hypothetical protein D3C73_1443610 [compost metagenome]
MEYFIGTCQRGEIGLLIRGDGGDDAGAAGLEQLGQQEADAAGTCMQEDGVPGLHPEG